MDKKEEKEKLNVGLLYLGLHNQLIKKYGFTTITRKEFFDKIGQHYFVPKALRYSVLIEMQDRNLIRKINRDSIEILNLGIDIEEDYHKLNKIIQNY